MVPFLPMGVTTVLDVGCGSGAFGGQLRSVAPELVLWALEPDPEGAAAARNTGSFAEVVLGSFPEAAPRLPESFFDCIFFNDVLEHVVEPGAALDAAALLLSPGGVVVASIPNVRCIAVLKPLVFAGEWTYQDYGLLDRTHLRFFTRRSMVRLFVDHGFEVESVQGIHKGGGRKAKALDLLLGHRLDEFMYQQYVVVAHIQPDARDTHPFGQTCESAEPGSGGLNQAYLWFKERANGTDRITRLTASLRPLCRSRLA